MEPMVSGSSSSHDASPAKAAPREIGAAHDAPVKPYSALDDIPGLPPCDPDSVDIEPCGFDLIWDLVRSIFGRKPRDWAA
jgi:hypothetical protein